MGDYTPTVFLNMKHIHYTFAFFLLIFISCSTDNDVDEEQVADFDRGAVMENYANNIIIPRYNDFKLSLDNLKSSVDSYVANPTFSTHEEAHNMWLESYKKWQYVEMFNMGKAYDISYSKMGNSYPCREDRVNSQISDSISNISSFSGLLLGATGFPAIGFMIYGNDSTSTIENYTGNDGPKYKAYLNALISNLVQNTDIVINNLESTRSSYISSTNNSATSSLNITVNDFVFYCEKIIRTAKMGNCINWFGTLPPGSSVQPMPSEIESYYKPDICKSLLINSIQSAKMIYTGEHFVNQTDGIGFRDYLSDLGNADNLINTIDNQFIDLENKVNLLNDDFTQELATGTDRMRDAFLSLQNLVTYFKSDMMTDRFGISPDYADNDGDGG